MIINQTNIGFKAMIPVKGLKHSEVEARVQTLNKEGVPAAYLYDGFYDRGAIVTGEDLDYIKEVDAEAKDAKEEIEGLRAGLFPMCSPEKAELRQMKLKIEEEYWDDLAGMVDEAHSDDGEAEPVDSL